MTATLRHYPLRFSPAPWPLSTRRRGAHTFCPRRSPSRSDIVSVHNHLALPAGSGATGRGAANSVEVQRVPRRQSPPTLPRAAPGSVWNVSNLCDHTTSQVDRIEADLSAGLRILRHLHLGNGGTGTSARPPGLVDDTAFSAAESLRIVWVHLLVDQLLERILGGRGLLAQDVVRAPSAKRLVASLGGMAANFLQARAGSRRAMPVLPIRDNGLRQVQVSA